MSALGPADLRVQRAAAAALDEIPRRARDILEHILINDGSAGTIARRNEVAEARAVEWIEEARASFRDQFRSRLQRQGVAAAEIDALCVDRVASDIAAGALRLIAPTGAHVEEPNDARIGTSIGGYTLIEKLGEGGMGAVYRAEHTRLGRAAIKVLRPRWAHDQQIVERLFREARAARMVEHPGVVIVYECGFDGATAYIAMELLHGVSVAARLREQGRLAAAEAVRICRQTASVLVATHRAGIAHRDLKPDNIFLVEDPEVPGRQRVKLLDFGIAKLFELKSSDAALTQQHDVMGSPAYMAPEQCAASRDVDARADAYSLGCTLFHLLAGRPPFVGTHVLAAHIYDPPPSLRTLVPETLDGVEKLVGDLLIKTPGDRASMEQALDRLSALEAELTRTKASPAVPDDPKPAAVLPHTAARTRSRMPWIAASVFGALAVVAGAVILIPRCQNERSQDPRVDPPPVATSSPAPAKRVDDVAKAPRVEAPPPIEDAPSLEEPAGAVRRPERPALDARGCPVPGIYKVKIDSVPQGATVYINKQECGAVGTTPWTGTLPASSSLPAQAFAIIIERNGYAIATNQLSVRRLRAMQELLVPLRPIPGTTVAEVTTPKPEATAGTGSATTPPGPDASVVKAAEEAQVRTEAALTRFTSQSKSSVSDGRALAVEGTRKRSSAKALLAERKYAEAKQMFEQAAANLEQARSEHAAGYRAQRQCVEQCSTTVQACRDRAQNQQCFSSPSIAINAGRTPTADVTVIPVRAA